MIYLDNAATSFQKPDSVKRAVLKALETASSPGRGGYKAAAVASETVFGTREALAELFNIGQSERIVFTDNATTAINTAIHGTLSYGDILLISSMEHNAVARPAREAERHGSLLRIAQADKDGTLSLQSVEGKLSYGSVKLVCMLHASNVCGAINDIEKIGTMAKKSGAIFMVDAAQSAGCAEIDVDRCKIDILAFPGHKGLFGPQGTGGLYIREGIDVSPLTMGGTGSFSESFMQPDILPDRYESGTLNVPGIAGLGAGVRFILKNGVKNIAALEREYAKILAEDLSAIPGVTVYGNPGSSNSVGVVSITTPVDSIVLAGMLSETYGIAGRAGLHCSPMAHSTLGTLQSGTLRFSPGIFNSKAELKKTASAVAKCVKG